MTSRKGQLDSTHSVHLSKQGSRQWCTFRKNQSDAYPTQGEELQRIFEVSFDALGLGQSESSEVSLGDMEESVEAAAPVLSEGVAGSGANSKEKTPLDDDEEDDLLADSCGEESPPKKKAKL